MGVWDMVGWTAAVPFIYENLPRQEGQKQRQSGTRKQWMDTSLHKKSMVRSLVPWLYGLLKPTENSSNAKHQSCPVVSSCWLFLFLHSLCHVPVLATLAQNKCWCRKQLTEQNIFTHVSFLTPHCAATQLLLLAQVGDWKGANGVICMGEREAPFLLSVLFIAGSRWWWNGTSVVTFFYRQKREVWGWTMNLLGKRIL